MEGEFEYIIVADSHGRCKGRDICLQKFSNIDWGTYLQQEDWTTKLQRECEEIEGVGGRHITPGQHIYVYKNSQRVFRRSLDRRFYRKIISYPSGRPEKSYIMWKTKDHDARNTGDIARL